MSIFGYEKFIDKVGEKGVKISSGQFGARMRVALENEGPVTLILDSKI
ncbi:MAG: D-aminoacyl-tRNA deacylase [candidate division NC10 bacterium]|nr:D-aminoacyl-tRNA deacylase [candidate division NC10 bacterium]